MSDLAGAVRLAGRVAPSRVVFGPHVTNLGHRRALSPRHVAYYARRAAGGAGVIVVETASVHPSDHPYERAPLASDCGPGWADVAAACRPHGSLVLASLGHAGSQGSTAFTRDALWAPSAVADPGTREVPVAVDRPEIDALGAGFADATRTAVAAGLDGVEVEAGQHAILRQFLSGLTNHRGDAYGTDRGLLLRQVLATVRDALGPDRVLGLRLCCDELAPWAGITAAPDLGAEIDYLVPVRGSALEVGATRPAWPARPAPLPVPGVPLVRQGSITDPADAQAALDDGCVLVEMTRALIAEPDLVAHVRASTPERIRPCTLTNRWFDVRGPLNALVSDDAEPRSGHESIDPPVERTDPSQCEVLVVGGGPAGLEAARTLALRGHRVRLVEREAELGGALRWAARLPGRERFALLIAWWEREMERLGVTVERGREVTAAEVASWARGPDPDGDQRHPGQALCDESAVRQRGRGVVIATGGRVRPPEFPADVPVLDPVALLAHPVPAGRALVHDPFPDGTGTAVAELLGEGTVLATPDPVAAAASAGDLAPANARLERAGVVRVVLHRLVAVRDGVARLEHLHTGERREITCGLVVDCSPRLPGEAFLGLPHAGDAIAPRTLHAAVREGREAARAAVAAPGPGEMAAPVPGSGNGAPVGPGGGARPARRPGRGAGVAPAPSAVLARSASARPGGVAGRAASAQLARPETTTRGGGGGWAPRLVFPAHLTGFAVDGLPTARHAAYYAARAAAGADLVITEEHAVDPGDRPYEKLIRGHDPAVLPGYRLITDAVHAHGARVLAQLNHNGGQSSGIYSRAPVWAPSPVPDPLFREVPAALDEHGIARIVARYADVAARCVAGGFDGVELQCSQASLLRQFLSPLTNRRTDGYGGPLENRVRIVAEVAVAVRAAIGDRLLSVRLCGDEGLAGGVTLDEAVATARLLEPHVDLINTSVGVATATLHLVEPPLPVPPGYARGVAEAIRAAVDVPVIAVGRFTEKAQLVGVGPAGSARGQIADPGLAGGTPCVACNQECAGRVGLNRPLTCLVNPRAGHERVAVAAPGAAGTGPEGRSVPAGGTGFDGPSAPAGGTGFEGRSVPAAGTAAGRGSVLLAPAPRRPRDVLVVGAGPGGLRAAVAAAERGHHVTLLERAERVGGQVAIAALAPGREGFGEVTAALHRRACALGVEIRTGVRADAALVAELAPDAVVVATGARPAVPAWACADVRAVLTGAVTPSGRVLIVDELGFHHAASTAELLAARGATVEIMTPGLVAAQDLGLTLDLPGFHCRAHAAGIVLSTDRVVLDGGDGAVTVLHHPTGAVEERRFDAVISAAPAIPEDALWRELRDGPVPVTRIGDAVAPRRADAAIREGDRVGTQL